MSDILVFSGWTQPPEALAVIAPSAVAVDYAAASSIEKVVDLLPKREVDVVIGWSLGGLIARQLLQSGQLKARRFISLAAPFQFVKSPAMPHAMPRDTFDQFYANFRDDTLRTIERFYGLVANGDIHARRIISELRHHDSILRTDWWLQWLDVLGSDTAINSHYDTLPPTLIIHGQQDAIIPAFQAEKLAAHLPSATLHLLPDCAHAPHLHDAAKVRQLMEDFISA